jgi:hypothetical protein
MDFKFFLLLLADGELIVFCDGCHGDSPPISQKDVVIIGCIVGGDVWLGKRMGCEEKRGFMSPSAQNVGSIPSSYILWMRQQRL